jgi:DNA-binding CsgD family transcriptional regulator
VAKVFDQYLSHYARFDPLGTDRWILQYDNSVARYTDFISPAKLADSEYGQDFLPQVPMFYCLCATLGHQGDPVGALGLHRKKTDGTFTSREKEIVRLLAPHLSQALHNISLLETVADSQGVGMILIGADGLAIYMNREARFALNGRPVSDISDPGLCADPTFFKTNGKTYRVRSLPMTSTVKNCFADLSADFKRARRTRTVILLEPFPSLCHLKSKLSGFGLSPRQKEIASLIIQGLSNRDIAERLFICEQTVKDHLHDIFERMKIRRRSGVATKLWDMHDSELQDPN